MTLHASSCSRTLQRHVVSSRDTIWISEVALTAAFDRYSKTWRRKASNVPGPLESRRRLGKRQLGDLSGLQCTPTPPAWAFSAPIDLTQWQWEAPQSPSTLQESCAKRASFSLSTALPRWLRDLALGAEEPSKALVEAPPTLSFQTDLDMFHHSIANAPIETVVSETRHLCAKFQQSIFLGETQPKDVQALSAEIWDALDSRFSGEPQGTTVLLDLYSAIVNGATTSKVFRPGLLSSSFWNALLVRISSLPVDDRLCKLFGQVMDATRHVSRADMDQGILAFLGRCFFWWSSPNTTADTEKIVLRELETAAAACSWAMKNLVTKPNSSRQSSRAACLDSAISNLDQARVSLDLAVDALSASDRHVRMISGALATAGPGKFGRLLHAANQSLLKYARATGTNMCELRYNWLSLLAQMPLVRQETLFRTAAMLSDLGEEPLSEVELSWLMISQWASRGYVKSPDSLRLRYERYRQYRGEAALGALALAICRSNDSRESQMGMYISLLRLLARLERSYDIINSLEALSHSRTVPRCLLQSLSAASSDHHVALHLQRLHRQACKDGPDWDPGLVEKHADKIVLDASLPAGTIWAALGIAQATQARQRGTYGVKRAAIVNRIATVLSEAPHLPNRVAFRQVSQCVRYLERVTGRVPAPAIRALYRVVSRDLLEQRPGRTARLRWFLCVLERNHGREVAWGCRRALKLWRYRLLRIWLARNKQ